MGWESHNREVKVLLIEDDDPVAQSIVASLKSEFEVRRESLGREGIAAVKEWIPEVVLLDLGLPDIDGLEVAREIRSLSAVPIIIVSARGDELDRIIGLEIGADDYVVKPFSQRELIARIRAVTRRGRPQEQVEESQSRLRIDERTRIVTLDGSEIALTAKEFDLLNFLCSDPGTVFRRNDILEHVWDVDWYGTTKTLDAHVASIRKKLGDQRWIEAVRGVGFRFVEVKT